MITKHQDAYLYCLKHKQSMVFVKENRTNFRYHSPLHRCAQCVAEAREVIRIVKAGHKRRRVTAQVLAGEFGFVS